MTIQAIFLCEILVNNNYTKVKLLQLYSIYVFYFFAPIHIYGKWEYEIKLMGKFIFDKNGNIDIFVHIANVR